MSFICLTWTRISSLAFWSWRHLLSCSPERKTQASSVVQRQSKKLLRMSFLITDKEQGGGGQIATTQAPLPLLTATNRHHESLASPAEMTFWEREKGVFWKFLKMSAMGAFLNRLSSFILTHPRLHDRGPQGRSRQQQQVLGRDAFSLGVAQSSCKSEDREYILVSCSAEVSSCLENLWRCYKRPTA